MDLRRMFALNWRAFVFVYGGLFLVVMFKFNFMFHELSYPYDVPPELTGMRLGEAESGGHYFLRAIGVIGSPGNYGPADLGEVLPMMLATGAVLFAILLAPWMAIRYVRLSRGSAGHSGARLDR